MNRPLEATDPKPRRPGRGPAGPPSSPKPPRPQPGGGQEEDGPDWATLEPDE